MKKFSWLLIAAAAIACNKDQRPAASALSDARPLQLTQVVTEGLPSPYYTYTFDQNNFVTHIQHAAGLLQYELQYEHNRLVRMWNNTIINHDTLLYHYTGSTVTSIELIEPNSGKTREAALLYDEQGRLSEIRWKQLNADFSTSITRKLVFSYNAQGNLASYQDHRNQGNGLELLKTHYFEQYDQQTNPEANHLVKDVFEHFLFLPQVQLQKNNPLKERIVGAQNDWSIDYSYTFRNGLPVSRTARLTQTRGTGTGTVIQNQTTYTYVL
jgi:hypothetical protein